MISLPPSLRFFVAKTINFLRFREQCITSNKVNAIGSKNVEEGSLMIDIFIKLFSKTIKSQCLTSYLKTCTKRRGRKKRYEDEHGKFPPWMYLTNVRVVHPHYFLQINLNRNRKKEEDYTYTH